MRIESSARLRSAVFALCVALVAVPALAAAPVGEDPLKVTAKDLSQLSGWFEGGNSIAFAARRELRERATVTITTTGLRMQVTLDLGRGVATIDGEGQVSAADRAALQDFAREVTGRFGAASRRDALHESLLAAAATLLGEAPAGWQPSTTVVLARNATGGGGASPTGEACQLSDQDGVDYLEGGCTYQVYDDICHDAQNFCFTCESTLNGCNIAAECPGNCLPGCTAEGIGWYTRDCAEYDRCCELHANCNTFGACLDEFRDSLNDLLFGWTELNCLEGCAP